MDTLHSQAVAKLNTSLAAMGAARAVAKLAAAQLAQERAGQPTSGKGATLVGTGEVIAP